ncbi:MAG: hypothetical protein JWO31_2742 [Phycisphaerales bacterium]|nr:hypothetical protein [Phycisphaerales bacterium]
MNDFLQRNSLWLILGLLGAFYVWIILSSRSRQARAESFMSKAQSDSEEYKRHNAAVEAKLDRIIEIMEQQPGGGGGGA